MNICNDIKQRINCVEYAHRNGLPIKRPGDRIVSPLRLEASNKSSFIIFNDFWYDFGDSVGGDVIDLAACLKHKGNRGEAIKELAQLTGVSAEESTGWKKHTQNMCNLAQKWHETLRDEDRAYLHNRKIIDDTINRLKIGYTEDGITIQKNDGSVARHYGRNRIAIPYHKNGYIYSWVARATLHEQEPKYIKQYNNSHSEQSPWGMHTLDRDCPHLIIAEGAFDALSFEQEQYPVLATMGGHFSKAQLPMVRDICRRFKSVVLCFDNDTAGDSFTVKFAQYLFSNKINFSVAAIPPKYKDVSDYYADGGDLRGLVDGANDGLVMLAEMLSSEDAFQAYIQKAARYIDKPRLTKLFSAAAQNFPADWLAEVRKTAFASPSEDIIAKAVLEAHSLRHLSNVGFYEYSRGAWRFRSDEEIQSFIADELGYSRTGAKLSSIIKLLKADTITSEAFDKKPLFNFINGTLELDTLKFRAHDPADLLSIQVDYPYDPQADCSRWDQFISEICNADPKRMSLLHEIAGYILFPDCSLEKLFVLTGDGSNGKSKFLDMLTAVFGAENRSSVTLSGLMADFQRINLSKSLFNVSTEIKANMSGAEEYLKQIASGETVSACFKGKNFIDFNPRCKMIFACNGQLKSKDTSNGLVRRMCIINFECSFVDAPDKFDPRERKKDVDLPAKLMKEIPGIFNWALEGYKLIRSTKSFTETDDTEQNISAFKEASNPLITFLNENQIDDQVSREDYYEVYRSWCIQSGHQQMSRTSFVRGVNKILPKNVIIIETSLNGRPFRGYRKCSN